MSDPLDDPQYLRGEARRLQEIVEAIADPAIKAELAAHSLHLEKRAAALDVPDVDPAALQLNIEDLASSVLTAAYQAEGEFGLTLHIGAWSATLVEGWVDYLLAEAATHQRRVTTIRTDRAGFGKLGVVCDIGVPGRYKGIPVLLREEADQHTMEVVFLPDTLVILDDPLLRDAGLT